VQKETKQAVLTLQLGHLAFPLMPDTLVGTDANSMRAYMFTPELGPIGQAAQGGYVRLELPAEAEKQEADGRESALEAFERALIAERLLKEGWEATKYELEHGIKRTIGTIRDKVTHRLATETGRTPPEAIEGEEDHVIYAV